MSRESSIETQITALESAIASFTNPDVKSYTMPDGRSVTRADLSELVDQLERLDVALGRVKSRSATHSSRNYGRI